MLARDGFYNGTTFHRVIRDFMAQGGDPTGTGPWRPRLPVQRRAGRVGGQARGRRHPQHGERGRNTNGSQFFITFGSTPHLNGKHGVFGKVTSGMDVVNKLRVRDPDSDRQPGDRIDSIEIRES